jgi:hypothetical protein
MAEGTEVGRVEVDLQGGFLAPASPAGAASLLHRFMDADDDEEDAVESELNHTPMERNRDLKDDDDEEELLLRPRPPPLSDSGRDHAGLSGHRSCSGFRLPDPDPDDDDGARLPRRSRPAMLRGPQWLVGRRCRVSRRALPLAQLYNYNPRRSFGRGARPCPGSRPELRRGGARVPAGGRVA